MTKIDMTKIHSTDAIALLEQFHVDARVYEELEKDGSIFLIEIENQELFFSLIWHEIEASRLLTPPGKSRTLEDVGGRFSENGHTFSQLATNFGKLPTEHNPNWFSGLEEMDNNFDYDKFGYIILTSATSEESKQSPKGSFYIYDGSHKSLVLAKKLKNGEIAFRPIKCFLLLPRRN
jgi:hypothetical protein